MMSSAPVLRSRVCEWSWIKQRLLWQARQRFSPKGIAPSGCISFRSDICRYLRSSGKVKRYRKEQVKNSEGIQTLQNFCFNPVDVLTCLPVYQLTFPSPP